MRSTAQKTWRVKNVLCPECGRTRTVHTDDASPQRCRQCYWNSLRKPTEHKARKRRENDRRYYWQDPEAARERVTLDFALNKEARLAAQRERYRRNPEKHKARVAVSNAISKGILARESCENCGNPETEAHHEDYNEPLAVRWLCSRCHGLQHRKD